jgi:hypothetical protein
VILKAPRRADIPARFNHYCGNERTEKFEGIIALGKAGYLILNVAVTTAATERTITRLTMKKRFVVHLFAD